MKKRLNLRAFGAKLFFAAIGGAILLSALCMNAAPCSAQFNRVEWEKAAGVKMAFEVASVKPSTPEHYHYNFPLTLGSNFVSVGNLFSATVPLRTLIGFAYKLSAGQTQFLITGLPDWVNSEVFEIEARAPIPNPTKDQFRLMVQSLLTDRFKMVTHDETKTRPFYALVLTKLGKTGPQLRPHNDNVECVRKPDTDPPSAPAEFAAFPCGSTVMQDSSVWDRVQGGGQDVSLDYVAAFLTGTGYEGTAPDRPVINDTGLTGDYDFWIEFTPEASTLADRGRGDPNGPSFPEALRDQLGLKLTATTGPIDVIVVDHIERPAAN